MLRWTRAHKRGVGRILADHGVVADELDGQRVVVHQQIGRNGELRLRIAAVGAAHLPRRGLDGGEQRSVQNQLEVAQLRQQAGRKSVVDVNLGRSDHVGLRQREVDVVQAVDAVQLDLRRACVVQRERVLIVAGSRRARSLSAAM